MVVVIVVYLFILKEDRAQKVLKICPDFFFFFFEARAGMVLQQFWLLVPCLKQNIILLIFQD